MRFLEDGPDIPDELLVARDEGQVLFFCGAGVSCAAKLPGFLGLAQGVLQKLRVLSDSPVRQLIATAEKLQNEKIPGVGGILAADRIFGLLERDFAPADIERAVGRTLTPKADANLDAHRILLNLCRGPSGAVQLVTTNFDLLFERANSRLPVWTPNRLPDLNRDGNFEGIVHLHGMFDPTYQKSVGGHLVLSSSEFGRAYLAEGWATNFIKAAIERYRIVFVGYQADDPPVNYLLEALAPSQQQHLYAFHEGDGAKAEAQWRQKHVTALPYEKGDDHKALWQTLTAWAERAHDPIRWRERLLRRAKMGPAALKPHERGQVIHLAATAEGARAMARAKRPLSAEWLCVFDPKVRYTTPGPLNIYDPASLNIDPFIRYGIDSDPAPIVKSEGTAYPQRKMPEGVIDVLSPLPFDGPGDYTAGLRGGLANDTAQLPPRLRSLADWFNRVCGQPAAMWWAAGQEGLHPVLQQNVRFTSEHNNEDLTPVARSAWRYLLEAWQEPKRNDNMASFLLEERLRKEGWNPATRRAYVQHWRPCLKASRPWGPVPRTEKHIRRIDQVFSLSICYPEDHTPIDIPDTEVAIVLPILRMNLECACALEQEIYPHYPRYSRIPPIEPDPNISGDGFERNSGLNAEIFHFVDLFIRLMRLDADAAKREFGAWPQKDDPIFARLRVWAAGLKDFLDPATAAEVLITASDRVFWNDCDQRDVLLAIAHRWQDFLPAHRKKLETRLRKGLPKERRDNPKNYPIWRAHSIADRLFWLKSQGCKFGFDVDKAIAKARTVIPEWTEEDGLHAADSQEGRMTSGGPDTSFAELVDTPIDKLIESALTKSGIRHGFERERDPFMGLIEKQPLLVLEALQCLLDTSEITRRGWTGFLQSGARLNDNSTIITLIAKRLCTAGQVLFATLVFPITHWLSLVGKCLLKENAETAWLLFDRLASTIAANPKEYLPEKGRTSPPQDWIEAAWNSTVGKLVSVLLADPQLSALAANATLPVAWTQRAERLLALPGNHSLFAKAVLVRALNCFYSIDTTWTEQNLLIALDSQTDDRNALLSGFFSHPKISGKPLFERLKPAFLSVMKNGGKPLTKWGRSIAGLFIAAWKSIETVVTDDELRTVIVCGSDEMRTHMLCYVEKWDIADKLTLLRDVWPLQLSARSPSVSRNLVSIAFDDEKNFVALADAVLPMLSSIKNHDLFPHVSGDVLARIFANHPQQVLDILWKILPERRQDWPYNAADVLAKLQKAAPKLTKSPKFAELRRRLING